MTWILLPWPQHSSAAMPVLEVDDPSDLRRTFKPREADSEDRKKAASQSGSSTSVEAAETDTRVTVGLVMGSVASAQPGGVCHSSTSVPDTFEACAPPAQGGVRHSSTSVPDTFEACAPPAQGGVRHSSTSVPDTFEACAPLAQGGVPSDLGVESEVSSHSLEGSKESSLLVEAHETQEVHDDEGGLSEGEDDDSDDSGTSDSPRCFEEGSEKPVPNPWKSFSDLVLSLEPWNRRLWSRLVVPLRTGFSWRAVWSAADELRCSLIYASVMLRTYRRKCSRRVSASLAARTFTLNCPKRPLPPTSWMREDL